MARKTLSILFRQYLFWMLFFAFGRLLFMLYHFRELKGIPFSEYAFTFIKAIFLDNSTTCYFLSFSFLFLLVHQFLRNRLFAHINRVYSYVLIIIVSIIVSAEFELYSEWGSKLNYKALTYLENPSEIFRSAGVFKFSIGILLIVLQIITGCYLYQKLVHKHYVEVEKNWKFSVLYFVFFPPLIFAGIRGGLFQAIPINQSDVYFSKHNFLNIAAVNSVWNLGHSIEHNKKYLNKNPYLYYTIDEAKENIKPLFEYTNDSVAKVLNTEKPNIVLIILESWSADLIKSLGGFDSITPQFACPPSTSILKQPDKFQKLNCIGTIFKNAGYKTSFLFGGQLNYGNIKGYMYYNKFDRINEGEDFPADIPRGWLGVPDEYLFKRHIDDMKNEPEPFFSFALRPTHERCF
jgi:hypothetical protein